MKEESLLLLSDLQKLINQVVLIDYTIIILGGIIMKKAGKKMLYPEVLILLLLLAKAQPLIQFCFYFTLS